MSRPFELYETPPVRLELKYGRKSAKGYPEKLDHFRIVCREKEKSASFKKANYALYEDVHEQLGETPKSVPIVLMSDSIAENFGLMRALFFKGSLKCSSAYGDTEAVRRTRDGGFESVECSDQCPFWRETNKQKPQCDISGSLYFKLAPHLPRSEEFGICRIKGTHAQRNLFSSLSIISSMSNGILANIPMVINIHLEYKTAQDGKMYNVPVISITHAGSQHTFYENVAAEIQRRAALHLMMNGKPHGSLDELKIEGVLNNVNRRNAFMDLEEEEASQADVPMAPEEGEETPDDVQEIVEGIPTRKAKLLIERFTDEEGRINKIELKKQVEAEKERYAQIDL